MKYNINRNVCIIFLLMIINIGTASAAVISIDPIEKNVSVGEQFSLNILIDPEGATVAGADTNVNFDPEYLQVVSVTEGNFFSRGGSTFFHSGTIDNTNGIISISASTLYTGGPNTIGTFATVNFMATGNQGHSDIELMNYHIYDTAASPIASTKQDGIVNVEGPTPIVSEFSTIILSSVGLLGLLLISRKYKSR
jgi:hypothetical protein